MRNSDSTVGENYFVYPLRTDGPFHGSAEADIPAKNDRGINPLEWLREQFEDGLDHPEIWNTWPQFLAKYPSIEALAKQDLADILPGNRMEITLRIVKSLCLAHSGQVAAAIADLEIFLTRSRQTPLIQGVLFFVRGMADPANPIYKLEGKICTLPFQNLEVLEHGTFLCCSGWLSTPIGNCFSKRWEDVWNSPKAEAIRASIHDGSYRFCNKIDCPKIQQGALPSAETLATETAEWKEILATQKTRIESGPKTVNLAYDRSCNLRCPSCRTSAFTANQQMRDRYDELQEKNILPVLHNARLVFITSSGDPFASRNFRNLIMKLGPDQYPNLRFFIITNGMLLTRKEWEKFPNLHRRVEVLRVSIDAASEATHETLRLGSKWGLMLENMEFFAELQQKGLVENFWLAFVVQQGNYKEMGMACDLAEQLGAKIHFSRIANWGTFSESEYSQRAVFLKTHPEYKQFLEVLKDKRLQGPHVKLGNLAQIGGTLSDDFQS